jgi:hypothetical protein
MNNKVFTSQDEGCQRLREEALTHREAQQVKHKGKTLKRAILESFLAKRGLALCCKGKRAL